MPVGSVQLVKGTPAQKQRKKRDAQDRVLSLLSQGVSVSDAMKQVSRTRDCYYRWQKEEDWFLDRSRAIRAMSPQPDDEDFVRFRYTYFGFTTPSHQQRIVDVIKSAEPRSINMILLPPGGGKTSVLEDFYNYKLAHDPNWRFCVISETRDLGRKILRNVSNRMVDQTLNAAYIEQFGPFKAPDREMNRPWNSDLITHVQANSGERDYSLEVKGAGSSVYGSSFDDIILDDIQSLKTLTKTKALLDYFKQTLFSRVMRANSTGRIFIIGTRIGPGDFYEELLRQDVVTNLVKIPALDEHGHSYFPKTDVGEGVQIGFSETDLKRVEHVVGPEAWSRQYMQEPVSTRGQTFTTKMVDDAKDHTRGITDGADPNAPGMFRIASLDPALAGHAVFRVAGFDYNRLYLLDGANREGLARYEEMWDEIDRLSAKWHPQIWIIEGNAVQSGIARSDTIQDLARKHGFSIVSHQTGRNKQDEVIGVASMAGSFLRGEISIPWGTAEAEQEFAQLCSELQAWRPDVPTKLLRQDEVMALWFLHLHWQKMKSQLANRIDRRVVTKALPWTPTRYPASR